MQSRGVVFQESAQRNRVAYNEAAPCDRDGKIVQKTGATDEETRVQTIREGTEPTVRPSGE